MRKANLFWLLLVLVAIASVAAQMKYGFAARGFHE
jgi:hypothetical protein